MYLLPHPKYGKISEAERERQANLPHAPIFNHPSEHSMFVFQGNAAVTMMLFGIHCALFWVAAPIIIADAIQRGYNR